MFRKLEATDSKIIKKYLGLIEERDNSLDFVTIMMWRKANNLEIIVEDKWIILKGNFQGEDFIFRPLCKFEDLPGAIARADELIDVDFSLVYFSDHVIELIKEKFKEKKLNKIGETKDFFYCADQFRTFAGRKMQKKRNHLNNFLKSNYDVRIENLTAKNKDDALKFLDAWIEQSKEKNAGNYMYELEVEANRIILNELDIVEPKALIFYIDNKPEAYSIVSTRKNIGVSNIEKANRRIRGLYQFVSKTVANTFWSDESIVYISREDSAGSDALKFSKTSYKPVIEYGRRSYEWK